MGFGDVDRAHRGREVRTRRHPVPDLKQIVFQILLELLDRHLIDPRRALIGLHLLVCLPDSPLRNIKRLAWWFQLVHTTPPRPQAWLIEQTQPRITQPLRSTPITEASPLLRIG